jgi:putative transposase
MAKTRIPEDAIRQILAEQEAGAAVADLIKKHKISSATFYNWKAKYGENKPSAGPKRGRPKGSKTANRLKIMVVDLMLEIDALKRQLAGR